MAASGRLAPRVRAPLVAASISWAGGYGLGVAAVPWGGGRGAGGNGRASGRPGGSPGAVAGWLWVIGRSILRIL